MSDAEHLATGREAEDRAVALLTSRGLTILARNVRSRRGELDIVARDGEYLVFVEVRSRRSVDHGAPVETVGPAKRAALLRAARDYLALHHPDEPPIRFDLVSLSGADLEHVEIIENAIEVEDPWR